MQARGLLAKATEAFLTAWAEPNGLRRAVSVNASNAYAYQYLPVVALLSNQIDSDVAARYQRARWLILRGTLSGTALDSTYVFYRDVVGYDVADFFTRTSPVLRTQITSIMEKLLGAE